MRTRVRAALFSALLASGFFPHVAVGGQSASTPTGEQTPSSTTQPPATSLAKREELTGDWGDRRTRWKDKGVVLDSSLTQFEQGVASGGTETGSEYTGTAQATLDFDFGKLAGWQNWSAEVKAEMRFGGPLLGGSGSISPVNTAALIPGNDGTVFAVTAANLTRLFPINLTEEKFVALSFGRYNMVDLVHEHFFAGSGIKRFFNIAQVGPLTVLRQIPLVANAISVAYIRDGDPFITLSVMDPKDHSVDHGLSDLFEDGVTFSPGINFSDEVLREDGQALLWRRHRYQEVHAI